MNLPLSRRLRECCKFIRPGDRVADIGCDHGYLGLHLLQRGTASFVFAADVNEGPLQSALRNARKYGLEEKMAFCLSDGVKNVPRDFDVMVCAGMGADTMVSILEAASWLKMPSTGWCCSAKVRPPCCGSICRSRAGPSKEKRCCGTDGFCTR